MGDWKIIDGASTFDLEDNLFFKVEQAPGTGMPPITTIRSEYGLLDGSLFQRQRTNSRPFSLIGTLKGDTTQDLHSRRRALIDRVKPDRSASQQPVILQYVGSGSTLQASGFYTGGLEFGNNIRHNIEAHIGLGFEMLDSFWEGATAASTTLTPQITVASANYIVQRSPSGVWSNLGQGLNNTCFALISASDGVVFAGGTFITAGGTTVNKIAAWNPAGSAWDDLDTGMGNGGVNSMRIGPNNSLYVAGTFTTIGSASTTVNRVAEWDISACSWSAMGSGVNDQVESLDIGKDGVVYIGGDFTQADGGNADNVAEWNPIAACWSEVGTGLEPTVTAIVAGLSASVVYAGGQLNMTDAGTSVCGVAVYSGSDWGAAGCLIGGNTTGMSVGPDGTVYATGTFNSAGAGGGISACGAAYYNGTAWFGMGADSDDLIGTVKAEPNSNLVHFGGRFTKLGGLDIAGYALWNGHAWVPTDIDPSLQILTRVYAIDIQSDGTLTLGFDKSGSARAAAVTSVNNTGTAAVYPVFTISGSGRFRQIKNYSTGQAIYFNLVLSSGEVVTVDLRPRAKTVTSTFQGNIIDTVLPGSEFSAWQLLPGNNNISVFHNNSSASITLEYKPRYWSLDGNA